MNRAGQSVNFRPPTGATNPNRAQILYSMEILASPNLTPHNRSVGSSPVAARPRANAIETCSRDRRYFRPESRPRVAKR